jgi:hypothetical protein
LNTVIKKRFSRTPGYIGFELPSRKFYQSRDFSGILFGYKKIIYISYPNVDDLVDIIKLKGQCCLMFKKDLTRAFRQVPLCPGDLHLVGVQWGDATSGWVYDLQRRAKSIRSL